MQRRQYIATVGTATVLGLAGCLGGNGSGTDSPDGVVEAYYEAEDEDEQEDIIHSVSIAQEGGAATVTQVWAAESVDADVTEEDLSYDELETRLAPLFEPEAIETISEEEAALVEGEVDPPSFPGEDDMEPFDVEVLVAQEDGDWKFVMQVS